MRVAYLCFALAAASPLPSFEEWANSRGRSYSAEEFALRRSIFAANAATIEAHNALNASWTMGVNAFSDLSAEEFKARFTGGYVRGGVARALRGSGAPLTAAAAVPAEKNWVALGAVTAVKNQGGCGSCWAFSATGAAEGLNFIKKGVLYDLSEQQLVSCCSSGGRGCDGGSMVSAFDYWKGHNPCSEHAYPYAGKNGRCERCNATDARVGGARGVAQRDESALVAAIAGQPVSVGVEADQAAWQHYKDGYMSGACGTKLDHGVLAVGYDAQGYKIKNVRAGAPTRSTRAATASSRRPPLSATPPPPPPPLFNQRVQSWGADWGQTATSGSRGGTIMARTASAAFRWSQWCRRCKDRKAAGSKRTQNISFAFNACKRTPAAFVGRRAGAAPGAQSQGVFCEDTVAPAAGPPRRGSPTRRVGAARRRSTRPGRHLAVPAPAAAASRRQHGRSTWRRRRRRRRERRRRRRRAAGGGHWHVASAAPTRSGSSGGSGTGSASSSAVFVFLVAPRLWDHHARAQ
jgi:hypothetical protein